MSICRDFFYKDKKRRKKQREKKEGVIGSVQYASCTEVGTTGFFFFKDNLTI